MSSPPKTDLLDRVLLEPDGLQPSSGFADSVLHAIKEENANGPAPIPFPWRRAWPLFVALLICIVILADAYLTAIPIQSGIEYGSANFNWLATPHFGLGINLGTLLRTQAAPALLAIAVSLGCMVLCRRLAGGWSASS